MEILLFERVVFGPFWLISNGGDFGEADTCKVRLNNLQILVSLWFLASGVSEEDQVRAYVPTRELDEHGGRVHAKAISNDQRTIWIWT
jgi:hypothetical protein